MSDKFFTISGYMVIEAEKWYGENYKGKIKSVTKGKPGLTNRQIAIAINIKVPNAFFERLMPVINIELPAEAVVNPDVKTVIDLSAIEVAENLHLEVTEVSDMLSQMVEEKKSKI